jgi:hypothetical protein
MPAIRPRQDASGSDKGETRRSWLGKATAKRSAGARVIELGMTLADAEFSAGTPEVCSRCGIGRDAQSSTSRYPNVFCSKTCERKFICTALASLSWEDCIRMHERLETLLVYARVPIV